MACRFIYQGKEYDQDSLVAALKKMPPEQAAQFIPGTERLPDMPFKSTWPDLALKRMIREAAEKNYDAISWTPGKAQAERYPETLRQAVSEIGWSSPGAGGRANPEGHKYVHAKPRTGGRALVFTVNKDGIIVEASAAQAKGKEIEELFGKDMSKRIMSEAEGDIAAKDFVIGGHGMEAFYDQMLVNKANALGKKYGARVDVKYLPEVKKSDPIASIMAGYGVAKEQAAEILNDLGPAIRSGNKNKLLDEIESADIVPDSPELLANRLLGISSQPVMVMKLTPAMKRAALREGFPLFSGAPLPTGAVQTEQERAAGGAVHKAARNAMRRK